MTKKVSHGWFSQKASNQCGYYIYKNSEGKTIIVTEVTENLHSNSLWDDLVYVGIVTQFVQSHQKTEYFDDGGPNGFRYVR